MSGQEPVAPENDEVDETAEKHKPRSSQRTTSDADRIRYNPSRESDS